MTNEEKATKPPRSQAGKPNTAYVNNLYLAPTKNYNPKLERINEDISSISNSIDNNFKNIGVKSTAANPFHQSNYLPTSQYSRRSSAEEFENGLPHDTIPTMLVNTNSDIINNSNNNNVSINLNQPVINSEHGVILNVRRIDSYKDVDNPFAEEEEEDEDDQDVVVSKASL